MPTGGRGVVVGLGLERPVLVQIRDQRGSTDLPKFPFRLRAGDRIVNLEADVSASVYIAVRAAFGHIKHTEIFSGVPRCAGNGVAASANVRVCVGVIQAVPGARPAQAPDIQSLFASRECGA